MFLVYVLIQNPTTGGFNLESDEQLGYPFHGWWWAGHLVERARWREGSEQWATGGLDSENS